MLDFKMKIRAHIRKHVSSKTKDILNELKQEFGDDAPSHRTVFRWLKRFKHGCTSLNDAYRSGHPITKNNMINQHLVKNIFNDEKNIIKISNVIKETKLCSGTLYNVMRKVGLDRAKKKLKQPMKKQIKSNLVYK